MEIKMRIQATLKTNPRLSLSRFQAAAAAVFGILFRISLEFSLGCQWVLFDSSGILFGMVPLSSAWNFLGFSLDLYGNTQQRQQTIKIFQARRQAHCKCEPHAIPKHVPNALFTLGIR